MPLPKRINLDNQVYFITTNTFKRKRVFKDDRNCKLFMGVLSYCQKRYKFKLYGYVVMPDHIHLLIQPDDNYTISAVIQKIKSIFAKEFKLKIKKRVAASLARGGDSKTIAYAELIEYNHPIWQKSFYDHAIRNEQDFEEKLDYIHQNPIRVGLVKSADQYKWSSYKNYI